MIRYLTAEPSGQCLLLLNLGKDLAVGVVAEPLLAPPRGHRWQLIWSSEHPDYDGAGQPSIDLNKYSTLPGDSALVFASEAVA